MGDSPLKLLDRQIKDTLTTKKRGSGNNRDDNSKKNERGSSKWQDGNLRKNNAKLFINDGTAGTAIDGRNASATKVVNEK